MPKDWKMAGPQSLPISSGSDLVSAPIVLWTKVPLQLHAVAQQDQALVGKSPLHLAIIPVSVVPHKYLGT